MSRTTPWLRRHWRKVLGLFLFLTTAWLVWWLVPTRSDVTLASPDKLVFAGFSPDGRTVATSTVRKEGGHALSGDRRIVGGPIRLWDAVTGSQRTSFAVEEEDLPFIAFSPDGALLVTVNMEGTLRLWDAATGQEHSSQATTPQVDIYPLQFSPYPPPLAFSPDSQTFAFLTPKEHAVTLLDVVAGQERVKLAGSVWAFSPDGRLIATGISEGADYKKTHLVKLWNVTTGQEQATLKGHTDWVRGLAFSPDGRLLASGTNASEGGGHGEVKIWDVATGREHATVSTHYKIQSLSFEGDGRLLHVRVTVGASLLWDVRSLPPQQLSINGSEVFADDVAFSPDGRLMAFSNSLEVMGKQWAMLGGRPGSTKEEAAGQVTVWDTAALQPICTFRPDSPAGHVKVSGFASDGKTLAVQGSWIKTEAGATRTLRRIARGDWGERWLDEGEARFFDATTGRERGTLEGYRKITLSPEGQTVAAHDAGSEDSIRLFEIPPRKPWGLVLTLWGLVALPFVGCAYWRTRGWGRNAPAVLPSPTPPA